MDPVILSSYDGGKLGADLDKAISKLDASAQYKDLSTIIIVPALEKVPTRAVASWWNLYTPPNQKIVKLFAVGMEVGEAYSRTIEAIIAHPQLTEYRYILTLETDNIPPPDGLVNMLATFETKANHLSALGALYFTKGEGGVPQIWGNPNEFPLNFKPQRPAANGDVVECCGTGMGFTLFKTAMFKDERLRKPWFKTTADMVNGMHSQDLYFWTDARKNGHRCGIDCSVKVGHFDVAADVVW